ncbi:guanylate kinase [Candidatus Pelagibacter sp.]|nr:guanylate kinase [Candidatus Pelagibacter sp.]
MSEGIMVILSSPSGAGKTTLVKLLSERKGFVTSISHTTRTPRSNEIDGKDYHFVSNEKFEKMIKNKEFLEYAKVFKNFYGTTKSNIFGELRKGNNVIFDIDWQGTNQIISQKLNNKLLTFFILPPSREELFKRLSNRDMKDKLIAEERMKQFDKDVLHWKNYDYVIINSDLEVCYKQISEHINNHINFKKSVYDINLIKNHIKKLIS